MLKALITAVVCAPLLAGCIAVNIEGEVAEDLFAEAMEEHDEEWEERQRDDGDREEIVERHLHGLRLAVKAWGETDRHDLAERTEMALHAFELELEGREDPEAREIMKAAPGEEDQLELLRGAARLYGEWDMPDRQHVCAEAAEWLEHGRERDDHHDPRQHGEQGERRINALANALEREILSRRELEQRLREIEERMEGIEESLLDLRNR